MHGSVVLKGTRLFRVRLARLELAHDFVNEVTAFVAHVAGIEEARELQVDLEPPVSVTVSLIANPSLRFPFVASTIVPVTEMHFCFTIKRSGL